MKNVATNIKCSQDVATNRKCLKSVATFFLLNWVIYNINIINLENEDKDKF